MPDISTINAATLQQWMTARLQPPAIEEELRLKGFDAETIAEHLKAFNRLRDETRRFNGFVCMGIGAFIGFVSCVLSITNPIPQLYNLILFGLTSVAIIIIFIGLYLVFE